MTLKLLLPLLLLALTGIGLYHTHKPLPQGQQPHLVCNLAALLSVVR